MKLRALAQLTHGYRAQKKVVFHLRPLSQTLTFASGLALKVAEGTFVSSRDPLTTTLPDVQGKDCV